MPGRFEFDVAIDIAELDAYKQAFHDRRLMRLPNGSQGYVKAYSQTLGPAGWIVRVTFYDANLASRDDGKMAEDRDIPFYPLIYPLNARR